MNKKESVIVLIITFVVVVIWIISDVWHTQSSEPLDAKIPKLLEPFDPNFDMETVNQLNNGL